MHSLLRSIRAWFARGNRGSWTVFVCFTALLMLKVVLFNWATIHVLLASSLWKDPVTFFAFWCGNTAAALLLGAIVFFCKRQYWTVVTALLLDVWAIANMLYFKANGLFLTFDMLFMADNLSGFWSSLYTYLGWDVFVLPLLTIVYAIVLWGLQIAKSRKRLFVPGAVFGVVALLFSIFANLYDAAT